MKSSQRRNIFVFAVSAVLLVAVGIGYMQSRQFFAQNTASTTTAMSAVTGPVIRVVGNTITIRDYGNGNQPKVFVIDSASTIINVANTAGDFTPQLGYVFSVGDVVVIRDHIVNSQGLEVVQTVDLISRATTESTKGQ